MRTRPQRLCVKCPPRGRPDLPSATGQPLQHRRQFVDLAEHDRRDAEFLAQLQNETTGMVAASRASTSAGCRILGRVRGTRTNDVVRDLRVPP